MNNSYSKVEILGKIDACSTPEEVQNRGYYYMKLAFKDEGSPFKSIKVFFWEDAKDRIANMKLRVGDIIVVTGQLSMRKQQLGKETVYLYTLRGDDVKQLSTRMDF